jgi:hypothetical protein
MTFQTNDMLREEKQIYTSNSGEQSSGCSDHDLCDTTNHHPEAHQKIVNARVAAIDNTKWKCPTTK